jgi:hypothetical protein
MQYTITVLKTLTENLFNAEFLIILARFYHVQILPIPSEELPSEKFEYPLFSTDSNFSI